MQFNNYCLVFLYAVPIFVVHFCNVINVFGDFNFSFLDYVNWQIVLLNLGNVADNIY